MVSQDVKTAISEAVNVASACEVQRMGTMVTELLEGCSRIIGTRMQQASASIEQKLRGMEQVSSAVLQYSDSLRVQGETLGGEIAKLHIIWNIILHRHKPVKQALQPTLAKVEETFANAHAKVEQVEKAYRDLSDLQQRIHGSHQSRIIIVAGVMAKNMSDAKDELQHMRDQLYKWSGEFRASIMKEVSSTSPISIGGVQMRERTG